MKCDFCKKGNQGHYRLIEVGNELKWICSECRTGKFLYKEGSHPNVILRELNQPLWRKLGLKPKPKELEREKYLKFRGMDYADWRKERDYHLARQPSGIREFENHVKKYGLKNAPTPSFKKEN